MLTVCSLVLQYKNEFPDLRQQLILQYKQLNAVGKYELQRAAQQDEHS